MSNLKLSPSALNLFLDCPRCFWLEKNRKLKRPRGIFPSLPGGMDRVIKTYFDGYRQNGGLPPEVEGKVIGRLFPDLVRLNRWRDWKTTDLAYTDPALQVTLSGALDDSGSRHHFFGLCITRCNIISYRNIAFVSARLRPNGAHPACACRENML